MPDPFNLNFSPLARLLTTHLGPAPANFYVPPMSANERVAQGFADIPVQAADDTTPVPLPRPRPRAAVPGYPATRKPVYQTVNPTSQLIEPQPMSFWQRNAAMMRDPATGELIDPEAAARAMQR